MITTAWRLAALLTCIATPALAQSQDPNAWEIYGREARQITCGVRPVLLNGSHSTVTLSGPCRYVRVAGAHNDVILSIIPGGTIEITGEHNDVFWHLTNPVATQKPVLLNKGYSNTFHRRTGDEN